MLSLALSRLASWAPAAPLLCAAHCAATPLLVLFLPSLHVGEAAELWLFAAVVPIAAATLWRELPTHRSRVVLAPVAAGLALWAASLAGALEPLPHEVTNTAGGLLVAAGMVWSARLRHRAACRSCRCGAHA